MTWDEIRAAVQSCDIVVDQFALGIYGAFAVEAMAAGRPVIGFWDEPLYESVGVQPPILNALPETLADVLDHLLEDPERAAKIGKESAAYARDVHDGRRTAQVFRSFLGI
jgi:glycosyltransferase involved in cell wall biosynthesis